MKARTVAAPAKAAAPLFSLPLSFSPSLPLAVFSKRNNAGAQNSLRDFLASLLFHSHVLFSFSVKYPGFTLGSFVFFHAEINPRRCSPLWDCPKEVRLCRGD